MSDTEKTKAIKLGVRDSFDFWLSQHNISFPELLQDAIQETFKKWLDDHEDEVLTAIGKAGKP